MEPLGEYRLDREPDADRAARSRAPLIASIIVGAAVIGFGGWFLWRGDAPPATSREARAGVAPGAAAAREDIVPLGPNVEPVELPPLDLTDALVRKLVGALSSRPEVAAWLATDHLIRGFVSSVDNVAKGAIPSRQLRPLAPVGDFRVVESGDAISVDARSFQRYDRLADTIASLDARGLARVYATLKPRLQEAYRELGYPDGDVDRAVEQAIVTLLRTPAIEPDVALQHTTVTYQFADPRLEALKPAQKQLLRTGPRNSVLVQGKLREIAGALGIPAARLPSS